MYNYFFPGYILIRFGNQFKTEYVVRIKTQEINTAAISTAFFFRMVTNKSAVAK